MTDRASTAGPRPAVAEGRSLLAKYGKFVVVGLTGVAVNLVVFSLTLDGLSPSPTFSLVHSLVTSATSTASNPVHNFVASAVAFAVATLWNFALNNVWTFRTDRGHRHRLPHRLGLYYGVSLGSLAVNEVVLFGLSYLLPPLFGQAVGILAGSVVGFAGNYRVTFAEAAPPP
jgi:putative flippase GtrA